MPLDETSRPLRSPRDLTAAGLAAADDLPTLEAVAARYAVAVTPTMAALIDPADPLADPIGRQFLPSAAELTVRPEEDGDPIGDGAHSPVPGVVHRYRDRVLLKVVGACAVYCRFCFRREMVGPGADALTPAELDAALAYVASREEVWEVILTGGDPLVLSPRRLGEIVTRLGDIPHVGVVRLHTRVPTVDPGRVTDALVAALRPPGGPTPWMMVHVNHWQELTEAGVAALGRLADGGIPLLAQTVLLRGVNDDVETLTRTFRALVRARVKPHYLHHGDLAPGTGHFRTTLAEGRRLMEGLRGDVSGLCQPTYVLDIPGGHGKVPVGPDYLSGGPEDWRVRDPKGCEHPYRG